MVGIGDVAREAGVSSATVSRALSGRGPVSERARARVMLAADRLGYVVDTSASSLASGRTRQVGAVVPYLGRWFYSQVLQGAQEELARLGYDLTLYNLGGGASERRRVFEEFLFRRRVDALIAISLEVTPGEVERLHRMGKPIVCVGGPIPGLHTLSLDDVAVGRLATEHLTALGHRRIAHIGWPGDGDFAMPRNRLAGWEHALRAVGVDPDPTWIGLGAFTLQSGHQAALALLSNSARRPTAIFAASDEMAIGAIRAALELGIRVPQDLSVIGIDDHELSEFFDLTTVAQYPRSQGRLAADLVLRDLSGRGRVGDPAGTDHPLPFDLVVRGSTAPPPG